MGRGGLIYPNGTLKTRAQIKRKLALEGQLPPVIEGNQERKTFKDYATIAIARSKDAREFSPQVQGEVKILVPDDAILNFIADLHAWHPRTNHERFFQEIETIMETPRSYIVFGGDLVEGVFWGGASMEQVGSLDEQRGFIRELWKRTKGRVIAAVSGEHDCVDKKTEALTKRGWLTYNKLRKTDEFLTLNPNTELLEWHKYTHFHKYKVRDLPMVRIKTRDFDFFGTENHRFFYRGRKNNKYGFRPASEFAKQWWGNEYIPMAGTFGKPDYSIDDGMVALIAWVIADGWLEGKRIRIGQRAEKAHFVREVLESCNIKYSEVLTKPKRVGDIIGGRKVKSRKEFITFEIKDRKEEIIKLLNGDKHNIPSFMWRVSDRQFDIFLKHFMLADGTSNRKNSGLIFQKNEKFINDMQALCAMHGYRSNPYVYSNAYGVQRRLNVCKRTGMRLGSPRKISSMEKYTGVIWDITIPNGNFMVRRSGKSYFTGNSKWAAKTGADPYTDFTDITGAPYKRGLLEFTMKAGDQEYSGLVAHRLRGNSIYNNLHPPMRASREIQGHDFYLSAHTHRKGIGIQPVREKGGARSVVFGVSGTYKETDEYTQRSGWIEQKTKQLYGFALRFAPDVKKIEIDEDIISANAKWG